MQNGQVFVTPHYLALATNMRVLWNAYNNNVLMTFAMPNMTPVKGQDITVTLKGRTYGFALRAVA